ncbi:unnamed protein product [Leptosia nina]|uniref:DUF4485 domain-containing protein n=1 Tax=Leptosia nina TaxID=320188 RepID=A0AAV1IVM4_9NEOP
MDENDITSLDTEYKRYLQILKPYLRQLLDQDIVDICSSWIKKLSNCKEDEKVLRNKYIFTLCYQLAKGTLEEPFLKEPSKGLLDPLLDEGNSDASSTEVECLVIERNNTNTKILYDNPKTPLTAQDDEDQCYSDGRTNSTHNITKHSECFTEKIATKKFSSKEEKVFCCSDICHSEESETVNDSKYTSRVTNLIKKLRQIKKQNVLLNSELNALREEAKTRADDSLNMLKVNNGTSTNICIQSSTGNLNCLKNKLQEVQESKNSLIETISQLQDTLEFFHSMKKQEVQEIEAKHKLEILKLKASIREDITAKKEKELEELKQKYEETINKLQNNNTKEMDNIKLVTDSKIAEKDKLIQCKDVEITQLKCQIDEIKRNQMNAINKILFEKPDISKSSSKTEELEKRLNKMERARFRNARAYEAKLAQLQRQKHLAECSLQLQLIKQRTQVINEVVDENQAELTTALDKLEGKYKEIVASVQTTAVQRRLQDQIALETIIQAICGTRDKYTNLQAGKTMRTNKDGNQSQDLELSTLFHGNKVGNVVAGKPFADDSMVNEYCLDSEKLGELFERVHIPQRDTGDSLSKK